MGAIRTIIALAEGLGEAGMALYDVVKDPGSGLMSIVLSLVGGRQEKGELEESGGREENDEFGRAQQARRH